MNKIFSRDKKIKNYSFNHIRGVYKDEIFNKKDFKKINPVILEILDRTNNYDVMYCYVYHNKFGKLPFLYDVDLINEIDNLEKYFNPETADRQTYFKLNRQILKDNKFLGTNFNATPFLRLKALVTRFKSKPLLPEGTSSQEGQGKTTDTNENDSLSKKLHEKYPQQNAPEKHHSKVEDKSNTDKLERDDVNPEDDFTK